MARGAHAGAKQEGGVEK
jgi:hypothetical protein